MAGALPDSSPFPLRIAPIKPLNHASWLGASGVGFQAPGLPPPIPGGTSTFGGATPPKAKSDQGSRCRRGLVEARRGSLARIGGRGFLPTALLLRRRPRRARGRRTPALWPGPAAVTVLWQPPRRVPALQDSLPSSCHLRRQRFPLATTNSSSIGSLVARGVVRSPVLGRKQA